MSIVLIGSTSGSCTLQEQAVAGTTVLTLPTTSGTVLTSASSISASSITTGTLPKAQLPSGSVLQMVQFDDNNFRSWSGQGRSNQLVVPGTFGDGSVFITRVSNTSKILVDIRLMCGVENDTWANFIVQYAPEGSGYSNFPNIGLTSGGITKVGCLAHFGASAGGGSQSDAQYDLFPAVYQYLLDPSTSQNKVFIRLYTTYGHDGISRTNYLNRPFNNTDNNRYTANSVIRLTEIAV
jgi:hypothetical protein